MNIRAGDQILHSSGHEALSGLGQRCDPRGNMHGDTAHIILDGEMILTCGGSTTTYRAGERPPDVPAGAVHSARMGPSGCRYLIGEK